MFFYRDGSDIFLNLARRSSWIEIKTGVVSEKQTHQKNLELRKDAFLGLRLLEYFHKEESKDHFYHNDIKSQIQAGLGGYKSVFTINPKDSFREDRLKFFSDNKVI